MTDVKPGAAVGFVGLGTMGAPMATRLAEAGYQVQGFDVSEVATRNWAERSGLARPAATLVASAAGAAAVILMLPDAAVVRRVLDELLPDLAAGTVVVDMSSSEPLVTRELAARAAGHAVKALNNLLSATHLLATSEAMVAAAEFGLDVPTVLGAINTSSGRSGSTENKWPNFVVPATFDSGFSLRLMLKDMRIGLGLAEAAGTPARLSAAATALWAEAAGALPADADHTEIARWLDPGLALSGAGVIRGWRYPGALTGMIPDHESMGIVTGPVQRGDGVTPAVALVDPKFPHNVGAAVRAASCYGVRQVWFSGDRVRLDGARRQRLPREERMRGYKEVEIRQADYFFDAFDGAVPVAVELRRNAESLIDFEHPEPALYVFGPEDGSLDRAVLARCHRFLVIPTKHCTNLSAAVYTVLYDRHAKRVRAGLEPVNSVSAGFDEPDSMAAAAGLTWAS